jgi:hypothetical protein
MTCRTLLAPYLPRGFYMPAALAAMSPADVAVHCSHWHDWNDRRIWVFPSELFWEDYQRGETRFQREAFEKLQAALVRYFENAGRAMRWMTERSGT